MRGIKLLGWYRPWSSQIHTSGMSSSRYILWACRVKDTQGSDEYSTCRVSEAVSFPPCTFKPRSKVLLKSVIWQLCAKAFKSRRDATVSSPIRSLSPFASLMLYVLISLPSCVAIQICTNNSMMLTSTFQFQKVGGKEMRSNQDNLTLCFANFEPLQQDQGWLILYRCLNLIAGGSKRFWQHFVSILPSILPLEMLIMIY